MHYYYEYLLKVLDTSFMHQQQHHVPYIPTLLLFCWTNCLNTSIELAKCIQVYYIIFSKPSCLTHQLCFLKKKEYVGKTISDIINYYVHRYRYNILGSIKLINQSLRCIYILQPVYKNIYS